MADLTLLEWAEKRAAWSRDALRRHALCAGQSLAAADKTAIVERVRHHTGMPVEAAPDCSPLAGEHLGVGEEEGRRALLCSLGPVKNLNRLAPDNQLHFALDGITVIYGDNGSGKSGYARVTKKVCRSLTTEDLLGNVFEAGARPPAEVRIRYRYDNDKDPTEVDWIDGTLPPEAVSRLSVFDSHNARFYVDRENRIAFPPRELAILQSHGVHCTEMDKAFRDEVKAIEKKLRTPLPGGYTPGGAVAALLARLDPRSKEKLPTEQELQAAAEWTDAFRQELAKLDELLAHDPKALAARSRRIKSVLDGYATSVPVVDAALSPEVAEQLKRLCEAATTTAAAASMAATDLFASEPLTGVGQSPWRHMYDHAKAYAASLGNENDKLPDQTGDPCLLCQEPLSEAAAKRVRSFNDFIADATSKAADEARTARDEAVASLRSMQIPTKAQVATALVEYGELGDDEKKLADEIQGYFSSAIQRRDALMKAAGSGDFGSVPELASSPTDQITASVAGLEQAALRYDEAAKGDTAHAEERARQSALRDRKKLSDDLPTVLDRLADLKEIALLKDCMKAVETKPISLQLTALRRSLMMQELEKRIRGEIAALDLGHIPFAISDRSADGESFFGVALDASQEIANNKVLSEGEQRALALACFLGEVAATPGMNGLVIDDPVSSLDHTRIRRVAERLAGEARTGRQVIVFTHNVLFYNEIIEASARNAVPVLRNFIRKSETAGFGLVSQTDEPWVLMPVTKRIAALRDRLKGFASVKDFDTDAWRRSAKDFYTDLRETWERLVEEALLFKVVERFNAEVKTQSLKGVVVEDADYKTIFWAMKRVSERSGHDMASGRNVPTPTPADMKADLEEIDKFRTAIDQRRKDAEKRRKALEEPPKAAIA